MNKETTKKVEICIKGQDVPINCFEEPYKQIEQVIKDTIMRFIETPEYKKEVEKKKLKNEKEVVSSESPNLNRRRSSLGDLFTALSNTMSNKFKKETKCENSKTNDVVQKLIKRQNSLALFQMNNSEKDENSCQQTRVIEKLPEEIDDDEKEFEKLEPEVETIKVDTPKIQPNTKRRSSVFSTDGNLSDTNSKPSPQLESFSFGESPKPSVFQNLKLKIQKIGKYSNSPDINKKDSPSPRESFGNIFRRYSVTGLFDHGKSPSSKTPDQTKTVDDEETHERSLSIGNEQLSEKNVSFLSKIYNKYKKDTGATTIQTPRKFSESSEIENDIDEMKKNDDFKLDDFKM